MNSCFGKWFCCVKTPAQHENNKNLTMETKIMNDGDMATASTIIDCVNDTKWGSMRATKQHINQPGSINVFKWVFLCKLCGRILTLTSSYSKFSSNFRRKSDAARSTECGYTIAASAGRRIEKIYGIVKKETQKCGFS